MPVSTHSAGHRGRAEPGKDVGGIDEDPRQGPRSPEARAGQAQMTGFRQQGRRGAGPPRPDQDTTDIVL